MSTQGLEHQETDERPERAVAVRRFDAQIEAGDGRTVSFRIAPFGERATCADGLGGVPKGVPYEEELMPGLYDHQLRAAHRVLLNFEHQQGLAGLVGHATELRREADGYHASFRIQETPDGDKALLLARDGVLSGASVESYWIKSVRTAAGVIQRVKAQLEAVAMCRQGAYPSAQLTSIRSDELLEDEILDEEFLPTSLDPELVERCRRLGIRIPQRYEAHLAETDTPDDGSDTSGDDTRPPDDNNTSSEET